MTSQPDLSNLSVLSTASLRVALLPRYLRVFFWFCVLFLLGSVELAWAGVEKTVHNLSVSGPGVVKSDTETEVCVFCHAAHVPAGQKQLWNREMPNPNQYIIYKSATSRAKGQQPDGASKLCLSCHDGTVSLGKVASRKNKGGIRVLNTEPSGAMSRSRKSNLGTDLSGMHPISIPYDNELTNRRNSEVGRNIGTETALAARASVPKDLLDTAGKVQCTTCHDAHEDVNYSEGKVPHFWRRSTVSEVCENCHTW